MAPGMGLLLRKDSLMLLLAEIAVLVGLKVVISILGVVTASWT